MASQGDVGPFWIQADLQTRGRGRRGREWISKPGNLYSSGVYPHQGTAQDAALMTFAAALSVADMLDEYISEGVSIKWPNDVLVGGAKISGILLEHVEGALIVGIGVNLMDHPNDTPYAATHILAHMAESDLNNEEPKVPEAKTCLALLSSRFSHWRAIYLKHGFEPLRQAWLRRASGLPGRVKINLENETFSGYAQTLESDGALQVRLDNGTIRTVHAGDVFFEGN